MYFLPPSWSFLIDNLPSYRTITSSDYQVHIVLLNFIFLFVLLSVLLTCFHHSPFLTLMVPPTLLHQGSQGTFIPFNLTNSKTKPLFLDTLPIQHGRLMKLKEMCANGLNAGREDDQHE